MEMQNQTQKMLTFQVTILQELKYKNWEKVLHRHVPLHNWTVEHNYSILLNIKIENTNAKLTRHKKFSPNKTNLKRKQVEFYHGSNFSGRLLAKLNFGGMANFRVYFILCKDAHSYVTYNQRVIIYKEWNREFWWSSRRQL